jgi:hypothetical protein
MKLDQIKTRVSSLALAVVTAVGALSLGVGRPAQASGEKTWRYVTYGLGAATVVSAASKKPLPAVIGAAGTYFAYKKWKDEESDRHDHEGWRYNRRDGRRDDRRDNRSSDRYDRRYDNRQDDYSYNNRRDDRRDRSRRSSGTLGGILNRIPHVADDQAPAPEDR